MIRARTLLAAWMAALVLIALAPAIAKEKVSAAPYYLPPGDVDLTLLLAPPPDPNSALQKYDEKKIAQILAQRSPADLAQAAVDAHRF